MYKLIKLDDVKPGMILARGITDRNGKLLLKDGVEITPFYIKKIKSLGIKSVFIKVENDADEVEELSEEIVTKIKQEIAMRFSTLSNDSELIRELRKETEKYFIKRKSVEIW